VHHVYERLGVEAGIKVVSNPRAFPEFATGYGEATEGREPDRRRDLRVPANRSSLIVSLMFYMCERSQSQNRRVDFYGTIFVCITTFR
jgi:hypothetical protein